LEKQFTINNDYKKSLNQQVKRTPHTKGGQNKETFLLTVNTFKKFCLKSGTNKADEIHDYFIKLEKILQDVIKEESNELKMQLDNNAIEYKTNIDKIEKEKDKIREKTLLEQFTKNVQCVYYGTIDNVSDNNECLIKFGNSNNLFNRVKNHKDTYINFRLINAFKVENKLQIENAMKENSLLNKRQRTITIKNKKYVELINYEGLSFTELDKIIKEIITSIEYSQENYIKLLEENKLLKKKIEEKNEEDNTNNLLLLKIENQRLKNENMKLMKKCIGLSDEASNEVKNEKVEVLQNYEKVKNIYLKNKITKNYDGTYTINGKNYKTLCGTREDVWNELSYKTSGGLKKSDLIININGKVVSKKKSIFESTNNKLGEINKERQKASIV
jgi:hypothetical protein